VDDPIVHDPVQENTYQSSDALQQQISGPAASVSEPEEFETGRRWGICSIL